MYRLHAQHKDWTVTKEFSEETGKLGTSISHQATEVYEEHVGNAPYTRSDQKVQRLYVAKKKS
jgi:hypothetical protein